MKTYKQKLTTAVQWYDC